MYEGKNYIDGRFSRNPKSNTFQATNPSTDEVYGEFPITTPEDIGEAADLARKAHFYWKRESRVRRADYFDVLAQLIKRDHDKLRDAISIETGKNLNESHAEVIEALHMCQVVAAAGRQSFGEVYASELSTKDAYLVRKPRGVVAVISPWNFPLAIGSFWTSAPAILEGNAVVHKSSELTPMVNQLVAELYHEAGFPPGVYNLVHGSGAVGAHLVRSNVDVILFTGSAEVGQEIRQHCASTHSKTCSIECGSKSANIIFDDADLGLALDVSIASAFKLSGQRCVSSSRLFVQHEVLPQFRDKFLERACQVIAEDPFVVAANPDAYAKYALTYGPMISDEQRARVIAFNELTQNDPETSVLLRGQTVFRKGHFLTPHVYESKWGNKPFLKNEVFGPHVAIIPFFDLDDVIWKYNDTEYGLALGIVTDDYRIHREIANRCTTGMLYVNGGSIAAESHLPFSSWKKSGYGASAAATWKAVTHTMAVTVNFERGKVSWAQGMN